MDTIQNNADCQTDFSTPLFPVHPKPALPQIGDLADQFEVIDAYLKLPDSIRDQDRELAWTVICSVIAQRKGVPW